MEEKNSNNKAIKKIPPLRPPFPHGYATPPRDRRTHGQSSPIIRTGKPDVLKRGSKQQSEAKNCDGPPKGMLKHTKSQESLLLRAIDNRQLLQTSVTAKTKSPPQYESKPPILMSRRSIPDDHTASSHYQAVVHNLLTQMQANTGRKAGPLPAPPPPSTPRPKSPSTVVVNKEEHEYETVKQFLDGNQHAIPWYAESRRKAGDDETDVNSDGYVYMDPLKGRSNITNNKDSGTNDTDDNDYVVPHLFVDSHIDDDDETEIDCDEEGYTIMDMFVNRRQSDTAVNTSKTYARLRMATMDSHGEDHYQKPFQPFKNSDKTD